MLREISVAPSRCRSDELDAPGRVGDRKEMSGALHDRQSPAETLSERPDRVDRRFSVGVAVKHSNRDTMPGNPVGHLIQPDAEDAAVQGAAV